VPSESRQTQVCNLCGGARILSKFLRKSRTKYNETPRLFKTCNACSLRIKRHKTQHHQVQTQALWQSVLKALDCKDLHLDFLSQPTSCVYCGRFVCPKRQSGGGLHLHRAELGLGLMGNNVVMCCAHCHGLRAQDYEFSEFLLLCRG